VTPYTELGRRVLRIVAKKPHLTASEIANEIWWAEFDRDVPRRTNHTDGRHVLGVLRRLEYVGLVRRKRARRTGSIRRFIVWSIWGAK
jgi:hypothetical protein